jgi:hypothetical protein
MSSKHANYGEEGQALFSKRTWLRMLVLFGFGGMIVTILFLLSGCGSERKTEAVSSKKEKSAASPKDMKSREALPRMNLGDGSWETVKKEPLKSETELAPGLTAAELEERLTAFRKRVDATNYEVFPGITKQELDDKMAAEQRRRESANQEIFPGITKQELDARMADHVKKRGSSNAGLPGITKEELNDRLAAERKRRGSTNYEVVPGITKAELDAKLNQSGKK